MRHSMPSGGGGPSSQVRAKRTARLPSKLVAVIDTPGRAATSAASESVIECATVNAVTMLAMLITGVFFIAALFVLARVDESRGRAAVL